jgi:hypothetical protein
MMKEGDVSYTTLGVSHHLPPWDPVPHIDADAGPVPMAHNIRGPISAVAHNDNARTVSPPCFTSCSDGNDNTVAGTSTSVHVPRSSIAPAPVAPQAAPLIAVYRMAFVNRRSTTMVLYATCI